jgi:hypothetical protein
MTIEDPDDLNASSDIPISALPLVDVVKDGLLNEDNLLFVGGEYLLAVYRDDYMIEPSVLGLSNGVVTIPNRDESAIYRIVVYKDKDTEFISLPNLRILLADIEVNI